jgi:hypothetical protein
MKIRRSAMLSFLTPFLAGILTCSCSHTQAQGTQGDLKDFVAQYVAAFNVKDAARLNSFLHPKSLACMTPASKDFDDLALATHIRDPIPTNYVFKTAAVQEKEVKSIESYARFPVRPALRLQIEYNEGEDHGILLLWLLQEKGRWYQAEACPTEQTLKEFREGEPARKARVAKTMALVWDIKEPLRSELKTMIRDHKTTTATKRYQEASGRDYETCMMVIYELTPEARQSQ